MLDSTTLLPDAPTPDKQRTLYLIDGQLYIFSNNRWLNAGTSGAGLLRSIPLLPLANTRRHP